MDTGSRSGGEVRIKGERIDALSRREMRPCRRQLQVVFQDPYSSLNPRLRIRNIIGEPLVNYGISGGSALDERVAELALKVGLRAEALDPSRTNSPAASASASASPAPWRSTRA